MDSLTNEIIKIKKKTFGEELFLHNGHKVPLSTCFRYVEPWVLTSVAFWAKAYHLHQIDLVWVCLVIVTVSYAVDMDT